MKKEIIQKHIEAIKLAQVQANQASISKDGGQIEDGGTCNLDSVVIYLPRWRQTDIDEISKATGVHIGDTLSGMWRGARFMDFNVRGQANLRTTMVESAARSLKESGIEVVSVYYQTD